MFLEPNTLAYSFKSVNYVTKEFIREPPQQVLVDQLSEVLLSLVEKPKSRSYKTFLFVIAATAKILTNI
jgi:hypothetical protein